MSATQSGDLPKPKRLRAPKGAAINGYDREVASLQTEVAALKEQVGKVDAKVDKLDGKFDQILEWINTEKGAREARAEIRSEQTAGQSNNTQIVTLTWTKLGVGVAVIGVIATVAVIFVKGGV